MPLRRTPFARWSAFIHILTLLWFLTALGVAVWPSPGKYPWAAVPFALVGVLVLASLKMWIDDFSGLALAVLILTALTLWTLASWDLPKWAVGCSALSVVIPLASLVTLVRGAGSADDPYVEWSESSDDNDDT